MDRDRRLTGTMRGQTDNPQAPLGFEFSNGWKVILLHTYNTLLLTSADTVYSWRSDLLRGLRCTIGIIRRGGLDLEIQMKRSVYIPGRNSASLASIIYMAVLVNVD
ncbi:hypothetical protein GGI43DRAFT_217566 [Trichoderma evansii]